MQPSNKVLFCPDLEVLPTASSQHWVLGFSRYILGSGYDLTVILNSNSAATLVSELQEIGVVVRIPDPETEGISDSGIVSARFHARSVLRAALRGSEIQYQIVITQGRSLCRYVAGGRKLQPVHWAIVDDDPIRGDEPAPQNLKEIETAAAGSRLIVTSSPRFRSFIESRIPSATSKTRLLPPAPFLALDREVQGETQFVLENDILAHRWTEFNFQRICEEAKELRHPPRLTVVGGDPIGSFLADYPGVRFRPTLEPSEDDGPRIFLIPESATQAEVATITSWAGKSDRLKKLLVDDRSLTAISESGSIAPPSYTRSFSEAFAADLPDYRRNPPVGENPLKVLLAGADFKFAGDLVDALIQREDIQLQVDLFESNAKPQPEKSRAASKNSEIIIAEFASKNAIWWSQNLRPAHKLIVHLHGYELLQDWIEELEIANCSAIVFASDFYRQQAIEMRGWPPEKLKVIPNSVNKGDFDRQKTADSRFHLGLVGIVPILKRPDLALDLLEKLVKEDERFTLHIRGHSPWNYGWEWKKAAHQDAYREFYRRIGQSPLLLSNIAFEPFSPDVANWFQNIGWILSPSTRETFHLSAIEGAASGSVPIAWRRPGSDEIIGSNFNVENVDEAAHFVLEGASSVEAFATLSNAAKRQAERYSSEEVRARWLDLITSVHHEQRTPDVGGSEERQIEARIESAWEARDPETAVSILDENIRLTQNNRTRLKEVEMFFRGIAAADERRFTHFLPTTTREPNNGGDILAVRPVGSSIDDVEISSAVNRYIGVEPPHYLPGTGFRPRSLSRVKLTAPNDLRIEGPRFTRLDRWFEFVKSRIIDDVFKREARAAQTEFAVQGPWWAALPVLQAANQLNRPCTWFIDDEETLGWIADAAQGKLINHYAAQIAFNCYKAASARVIALPTTTPQHFPLETLDAFVAIDSGPAEKHSLPKWSPSAPHANRYSAGPLELTNAPDDLIKPLEEVSVGLLADQDHLTEWGSYLDVSRLSPSNFEKELTPSLDVVCIHPSSNDTGPWTNLIESRGSSSEVVNLLDRARLLGATTCFIWDSQDLLPPRFWTVARKADVIATKDVDALGDFLKLHPSAIRAISIWDTDQPLADRLTLMLRSAYVPVQPPIPVTASDAQDLRTCKSSGDSTNYESTSRLPELERIAVFSDINPEVWRSQTLPSSLYDVYTRRELANLPEADHEYIFVAGPDLEVQPDLLMELWLDAPKAEPVGWNEEYPALSSGIITSDIEENRLYSTRKP